jgi:hypothetical protein
MPLPEQTQAGDEPAARAAGRSSADVALADRLLAATHRGADVRARKVRRLRAAIKVKAYENDLKLAVAAEKLMAAIARDRRGSSGPSIPSAD